MAPTGNALVRTASNQIVSTVLISYRERARTGWPTDEILAILWDMLCDADAPFASCPQQAWFADRPSSFCGRSFRSSLATLGISARRSVVAVGRTDCAWGRGAGQRVIGGSAQPQSEAIEIDVDHRRREQRQGLADDQSADDCDA